MKKMKVLNRRLVIFAVAISMVLSAVAITTVLAAPTLTSPYSPGTGPSATKGIVWDNSMNYDSIAASQDDTALDPPLDPIVADDFILTAPGTIVRDVHWVGGYWNGPPDDGNFDWEITFYEDDGTGMFPGAVYAGPFLIANADCHETLISAPGDMSYWVALPSDVSFTDGIKYWLSIQGIGDYPPQSGWAVHEAPINLNPCVFKSTYFGYLTWTPSYDVFGVDYDACFQLTDDIPEEVWWDDDYKWLQNPDPFGWDVMATWPFVIADDFECTETGWIKDIHFWGSWFENFEGIIESFHLSIHDNIVGPPSSPGIPLWEREIYFGDVIVTPMPPYLQGWIDPWYIEVIPDNHELWYRYDIILEEPDWFYQELGTIYWLDISAIVPGPELWGWKTTVDPWNDMATFAIEYPILWLPIEIPEPVDLAFVITGEPEAGPGCVYEICLEDSYGDGWNGGTVDVFVDGSPVLTGLTLASGYGPECHTFAVETGDEITTDYTAGSYAYENSYYILDEEGYTVWTEPGEPGDIPSGALYADCDPYTPDPGETCDDAIVIPSTGIYTCPGAPLWYVYTATIDGNLRVDACGLTSLDTKLEIWDECSDMTYIAYNDDACYGKALQSELVIPCTTGEDYYIFWDMYNSGDYGIPFDFRVEEELPVDPEGNDCSDPIDIALPADFDYHDLSQTTCTRVDDYEDTCLGYYDGGEDIIYEIVVTSAIVADIILDNTGATWIGMAIDDSCPPDMSCVDYVTSYTGPWEMTVSLAPGTYYLMVDTWPSPECISSFDLHIINAMEHDVGVSEIVSPFGSGGLPKGDTFYAEDLFTDMLVSFDSDIPGTFTDIAGATSTDFLAGGCFAEDTWYAVEYGGYGNDNLWTIDEGTGVMTLVGSLGASLNGIAFDDSLDTLYGCSGTDLYTVHMGTGTATLVGGFGSTIGSMIGIASDGDGNLYGYKVSFTTADSLYSIDPSTGAATEIGSLGVSMLYAQDCAFDKDNDLLYIAAYTEFKAAPGSLPDSRGPIGGPQHKDGGLYICDVNDASLTSVGGFPGGAETACFAIPYTLEPEECWPQGTYPVEVKVKNYGDYTESFFDVCVEIWETTGPTLVYTDTETVIMSMNPGDEILLDTFDDWTTTTVGDGLYEIEACTLLLVDDVPANDCEDEDGCLELVVADADGPYFANGGNFYTVDFDGTGSSSNVVSYEWDFGDGDVGTGATPTHTYSHDEYSPHTITVTLTVYDQYLNSGSDTTTVTIAQDFNDPPIVQLEYPRGGESLGGTINIQWFAIDSEDDGSPSISLSYTANGGDSWVLIAEDLENNVGEGTYKDRGEYSWSAGSLPTGNYMVKIQAFDYSGNRASDTSEPFTIGGTGATGLTVSYVTVGSSNAYIKDGDSLEINAGITFGQHISADYVTADLSGLGKGTSVPADSFDGFTAIWTIDDVACDPSDGPITITVTVTDGSSTDSNTATIIADNFIPELNVITPDNALYFFGTKLFALNKPIIIGAITIEATAKDFSSGLQKTEIYIDDELKETFNSEWYMNLRLMGRHTLKIVAYDNAGNVNEYSQTVRIYNPFGE